jgi:hypothetical protein
MSSPSIARPPVTAVARLPHRAPKPNAAHFPNADSGSSKISCVDSVPLPRDAIPAAQLKNVLSDLAGNTLDTNSSFIEQLLPRERLPFPVNEDTLKKLSASVGRINQFGTRKEAVLANCRGILERVRFAIG